MLEAVVRTGEWAGRRWSGGRGRGGCPLHSSGNENPPEIGGTKQRRQQTQTAERRAGLELIMTLIPTESFNHEYKYCLVISRLFIKFKAEFVILTIDIYILIIIVQRRLL